MRAISMLRGAVAVSVLAAAAVLPAEAQETAGALRGTVTDATGAPLAFATVVATSPALQGTQSEFTDSAGQYHLSNLPPGAYGVLFIYGGATVKREGVEILLGRETIVNAKIDTQRDGEVITIKERAPSIDSGSTKQGTTVQPDFLRNVPSRERTWAGALGAAPGAQGDLYGTSFSGSTSVENTYLVDGVNTSGVTLGQGFPVQGSLVMTNFIQEIEVITGGYNAEFGRSTGGVVNVITKTGSNELHGSVFANLQALTAPAKSVAVAGSALRPQWDAPTIVDVGFDLGGPIIKDKLWFYVGFAPMFTRQTVQRIAGTQVDREVNGFSYRDPTCAPNQDGTCDGDGNAATSAVRGCERTGSCEGDGVPDLEAATDSPRFEEIDRTRYIQAVDTYQTAAKLNLAVTPEHQGQVSLIVTPYEAAPIIRSVDGTPTATQLDRTELTSDLAMKWTSKLLDSKTQLDAVLGWHRWNRSARPFHRALPATPSSVTVDTPQIFISDQGGTSTDFSTLGAVANNPDTPESLAVADTCADGGPSDVFPLIQNCPLGGGYGFMSPGRYTDRTEQRLSAKIVVTQRARLAGHHQLKGGFDVEASSVDDVWNYTGGSFADNRPRDRWRVARLVHLTPDGQDTCSGTLETGGMPVPCGYVDSYGHRSETRNYGGFLQDSWSILPNLTLNAGVRYEQQHLRRPDDVLGHIDPITGKPIDDDALVLRDLLAPRLGIIYDWTREGRSKIYASWGRFYESVPLDWQNVGNGDVNIYLEAWPFTECGEPPENMSLFPSLPSGCPVRSGDHVPLRTALPGYGGDTRYGVAQGAALVMPGLAAQYLDELVLGVEYEVLPDLRLGLSYQNRRLGRVIEDLSTDGANTYFLGNPGEFSPGAEADLERRIAQIPADTIDLAQATVRRQLITRLEAFRKTRLFDTPQRVYNAVQLTAVKRFSRSFMVQGSYTYSSLRGDYPGLFSPDTGQLDPNLLSQYDLFELLGNRIGPLPFDRPHAFKLDGYHTLRLGPAGALTTGLRLRGQSGIPVSPRGAHWYYGTNESFLLPRASDGRTRFETSADLHVGYQRKLGALAVDLVLEIFNVLNDQGEVGVDQTYTRFNADPIIGGSKEDLYYLKSTDDPHGGPVPRNRNYRHTDTRQEPLAVRFGVGLSF